MTNINRFPKEGSVMKIIVGPKAVIRFVISKQVVCKFIYIFLKVSLVLFLRTIPYHCFIDSKIRNFVIFSSHNHFISK